MFKPRSACRAFARRFSQGFWVWALTASVAVAVVVTAEQVAAAVANSPYANALLRNNSSAVGSLAMFESGGETTIYNGSCCYGVLQMSTSNIRAAGYTPQQYAALPLQDQVNAWARMQSQALSAPVVSQLQAMGTFNGQPVDFSFLLACVQLGQGNCATMVASGTCLGFADRNGTTICGMAARMRANLGLGSATPSPTPRTGTTWTPTRNGYDYASPEDAFAAGAGGAAGMSDVASAIRIAMLSLTMLLGAMALIGHFGAYVKGYLPVFALMRENKRVLMVAVLVMVVLL